MTSTDAFFFIFDFYLMKESNDDNDVLPSAILYFYPRDDEIRKQKLLECGEIVGITQYFQHEIFQSITNRFYFQENLVVHEHFGRHSCFLSLPNYQCTSEQAYNNLKRIMNLFNILYGTWNRIIAIYEKDHKINEFLNEALTPIVDYVMNKTSSILNYFSIVEYAKLKDENRRVLLESKHCLNYLKKKYGIQDGLIGFENKVLHSTWDPDTTFYLQMILLLRKQLPKDLIHISCDSKIQLKSGVSLFRIYLRRSINQTPILTTTDQNGSSAMNTNFAHPTSTIYRKLTPPINISKNILNNSASSKSLSITSDISSVDLTASLNRRKHCGMLILTDTSLSSEGTDIDTDTIDEISSLSAADTRSISPESITETTKLIKTEDSKVDVNRSSNTDSFDSALTDEDKLNQLRSRSHSRSSTMSNDLEKTLRLERLNSLNETIHRIEFVQIGQNENSDSDDGIGEVFDVIDETESDSFRDRTATIVGNTDKYIPDFLKSEHHEIQVSWTNIPDCNNEDERDELVLYVQKNSRMMFAGVFPEKLLTVEYLNSLWNMMLPQMASMEAEIPASTASNENLRVSSDVKFHVIENNQSVEFVSDGNREYKKIPSEESTKLALFARAELKKNSEHKTVGLSRGNHVVSVDHSLPNRMTYLCRRIQENL